LQKIISMKDETKKYIAKLKDVINEKRHPLYEKSVKLQKDYEKWMTGEGLDTDLRTLRRRESVEDFQERKRVTTQILPRVIQNACDLFDEAFRNNNIKISVESENPNSLALIQGQLNSFYKWQSIDEYWQGRFKDLTFQDPNSWIMTEFYDSGDINCYPLEISSTDMLDYSYVNGKIDYVIFKRNESFFLYTNTLRLKATKEGKLLEAVIDDLGNTTLGTVTIEDKNKVVYTVEYSEVYEYNESFALQIGYKRDRKDKDLFIAPTEKARFDIIRLVNMFSEYDINLLFHVFLQKYEYGPACTAPNCNSGVDMTTNQKCNKCRGTGIEMSHESGMDTLKVPLPQNVIPSELLDLSKLSHYTSLPIDVVKHQKEEILQTISDIERAIAGTDIFTKSEVQANATATQINDSTQKKNNVLYPFAVKYCQTYQFFTEKIADILQLSQQIDVEYWIDKNMMRESVGEMLGKIATANTSGVPQGMINDMYDDVAYVMYLNAPEQMKKHNTRKRIDPFWGVAPSLKQASLSMLPIDNYVRVLSTYIEYILTQCEEDAEFYNLPTERQDQAIAVHVTALQEQVKTTLPPIDYDLA
jgi:hypothetical protein